MGEARGAYTHGMDVEAVRDIARRLAQAQRELADAAVASDTAVRVLGTHWGGEDSAGLHARWPALRALLEGQVGDLAALVDRLRTQAQEQDQVSSAGGGASGGPDGGGVPRSGGGRDGDGSPDGDHGDGDDGDDSPDDRRGPGIEMGHEAPDPDDPRHRGDPDRSWTWNGHKDWVDNGPQHRADPRLETKVVLAGEEQQLWEEGLHTQTWGEDDGTHAGVEVGTTEGTAAFESSIGGDGLTTTAGVSAAATAFAASAQYANSHGTTASVRASAGAEANAQAGLSLGTSGFAANAGVDAFAGGKVEAGFNQDFGAIEAGGNVEISYGIGFEAEADASFTADHVGVSLDLNATLGLGIGGEIAIGFDPPDLDLPDLNPF